MNQNFLPTFTISDLHNFLGDTLNACIAQRKKEQQLFCVRGVLIAADLVIAESRLEPISKTNIFAIVEIKFQGDSIKQAQFDQYNKLLKVCKAEKEKKYGKGNNYSGKGVEGGYLSLFRYPEDIALEEGKGKPNEQAGTKKSGRGGR